MFVSISFQSHLHLHILLCVFNAIRETPKDNPMPIFVASLYLIEMYVVVFPVYQLGSWFDFGCVKQGQDP